MNISVLEGVDDNFMSARNLPINYHELLIREYPGKIETFVITGKVVGLILYTWSDDIKVCSVDMFLLNHSLKGLEKGTILIKMVEFIKTLAAKPRCAVVMVLNYETRKIANRLLSGCFHEVGVLENYFVYLDGSFSDAFLWYKTR